MMEQQVADLDREFGELLAKTPIHRSRWIALLVALIVLPSLLTIGGWWYVKRVGCEATNRATHKVTVVVDRLAAPVTYPKGAGSPLRAQVDAANRKLGGARRTAEHLLTSERC